MHAKYDYLDGDDLRAFEQRAALLKGLPPLNIEKLYVITEDDQLRNGEMVLFIGLRVDCVTTVFGLPSKLYREIAGHAREFVASSCLPDWTPQRRGCIEWRHQCR